MWSSGGICLLFTCLMFMTHGWIRASHVWLYLLLQLGTTFDDEDDDEGQDDDTAKDNDVCTPGSDMASPKAVSFKQPVVAAGRVGRASMAVEPSMKASVAAGEWQCSGFEVMSIYACVAAYKGTGSAAAAPARCVCFLELHACFLIDPPGVKIHRYQQATTPKHSQEATQRIHGQPCILNTRHVHVVAITGSSTGQVCY